MNRNTTGYYLTPSADLRHAHIVDASTAPIWHHASDVHPDDHTAHTLANSWDQLTTVWARANSNLTPDQKGQLVSAAQETHNYKLGHYGDI